MLGIHFSPQILSQVIFFDELPSAISNYPAQPQTFEKLLQDQ